VWQDLLDADEKVWLFHPSQDVLHDPSVQSYLNRAYEQGGCNRVALKVSARSPWYQVPLPLAPEGFLSGMSSSGPALTLNSMQGLTATNTLYTVRFGSPRARAIRWEIALTLLTSPVMTQVRARARRYPGGLLKMEPGDLATLVMPELKPVRASEAAYRLAYDALSQGDIAEANRIADTHLSIGDADSARCALTPESCASR
jgi:hypothetical protein